MRAALLAAAVVVLVGCGENYPPPIENDDGTIERVDDDSITWEIITDPHDREWLCAWRAGGGHHEAFAGLWCTEPPTDPATPDE